MKTTERRDVVGIGPRGVAGSVSRPFTTMLRDPKAIAFAITGTAKKATMSALAVASPGRIGGNLILKAFACALLGTGIFIAVVAWAPLLADPDIFWHIKTGEWIMAHGDVPRVDIWSHTVAGEPWRDMEWPAQIVMALTYRYGGWVGLSALGGATVVLTWALLVYYLQRYWNAWVAFLWATGAI